MEDFEIKLRDDPSQEAQAEPKPSPCGPNEFPALLAAALVAYTLSPSEGQLWLEGYEWEMIAQRPGVILKLEIRGQVSGMICQLDFAMEFSQEDGNLAFQVARLLYEIIGGEGGCNYADRATELGVADLKIAQARWPFQWTASENALPWT